MTSRLAAIAVDALDPEAVAASWCEVLAWRVAERDEGVVSIEPADGAWPTTDVIRVPERRTAENRLHLDLRADGTSTGVELDRLLALGARRVDVGQGPDASWVVLADTAGDEFRLLSRSAQEV